MEQRNKTAQGLCRGKHEGLELEILLIGSSTGGRCLIKAKRNNEKNVPLLLEIRLKNIVEKCQEPEQNTLGRGEMSFLQQRQVWGQSEILNRPLRL